MAIKLSLASIFSRKKSTDGENTAEAPTVVDGEQPSQLVFKFGLGFLAQYSVPKQLQILGGALAVFILLLTGLVWKDSSDATNTTVYVATAGEMRMLSQRLAKAANLSMQGDPFAFKQLRDSRDKFSDSLEKLTNGGELVGLSVPSSPSSVRGPLEDVTKAWKSTEKNASQLLSLEKKLVLFGVRSFAISENSDQLLDLSEQLASLRMAGGANSRELLATNQLVTLTQRIAKNIGALRLSDSISPEVTYQLSRDTQQFGDILNGLQKGSDKLGLQPLGEGEAKRVLSELVEAYQGYQSAVAEILGSMQELVFAKQAGARIFVENEALLNATDVLAKAYQRDVAEQLVFIIAIGVLVVLTLGCLALMAKVFLDDTKRQAIEAEARRAESDAINRQNQDAILRLMNELGDLADGDLTVTATVSEDMTGAIADSINYTVEELRVLVGRINDAAIRVTSATESAQQTSAELLRAAKRQSEEIQEAGSSVLAMASSMSQVSDEARQSSQVARQSLDAATKGTVAVQDSIKGMNGIREQIQETSKRIKRLGESSQEIGEIVELISDITEQTNVLALNAAIQAASAGDAGRGFTVVAEEVQRLAERSAEATKQIAAIVKTIQTDTQGAVSAMEESTRGVVEGAKLSDAAGQALSEIGDVSHNLAELIADISDATRQQAEAATGVATLMQDILHVTEQTTIGTQQTAHAVGELGSLATELKGSVANFKVA